MTDREPDEPGREPSHAALAVSFDADGGRQADQRRPGRQGDASGGALGLTTAEREELAQLRKENRRLKEERDILEAATAFFAKRRTS